MVDSTVGTAPAPGAVPGSVQQRSSLRWYLVSGLLILLAGAALGGWAVIEYLGWRSTPATAAVQAIPGRADAVPAPIAAPATAPARGQALPQTSAPANAALMADRVALLEARVSQLTVAAESMNGNAARAEALLIAFAARRALDRGLALGTLESQLRLRFGDAQPNAVRTVIETARMPVTLDRLQSEFDRLTPELTGASGAEAGLWSDFRRGVGELFVVRHADTPSTRIDQRMARIHRLLDAGLVNEASREVALLPGATAAAAWLDEAARYHEARRALDLIETAAILAPREVAANITAPAAPIAAPRR